VKIRLFQGGQAVDVDLATGADGHEVAIGEARLRLSPIATSPREGAVRIDGRGMRYLVVRSSGRIRIAVGGECHEFDLTGEAASRGGARATAHPETRSPMPGKVLQVTAAPGSRVKPGDPLLVLEAMKMENVLVAEVSGVIAEVHVREGDMVEPGKLLVLVKPDE
jgi:acetyl-CoA/propionyl-CoA carboxylase biotin carboxyl carrier protein